MNQLAAAIGRADAKHCIRNAWSQSGLGEWPFIDELPFAPPRKWRFDWACVDAMLAIEIDGVTHERKGCDRRGGRHQNAKGFEGDCEKLNAATALGWAVLRFTPDMVTRAPVQCAEMVRDVMASRLAARPHIATGPYAIGDMGRPISPAHMTGPYGLGDMGPSYGAENSSEIRLM